MAASDDAVRAVGLPFVFDVLRVVAAPVKTLPWRLDPQDAFVVVDGSVEYKALIDDPDVPLCEK